jgi:hypothetical protein
VVGALAAATANSNTVHDVALHRIRRVVTYGNAKSF